jgi:hypothetical protein
MEGTFRHEIGLPSFPTQWMDLTWIMAAEYSTASYYTFYTLTYIQFPIWPI